MKHKVLLFFIIFLSYLGTAFAQKVTLNFQQTKLEKVLTSITEQTGYTFAYSQPIVDVSKTVSISVSNLELAQALERTFSGTDIVFEIKNKKVFLTTKLIQESNQKSQLKKKNISGTVVDESGESIIGASVYVKGTTMGTMTDVYGKFSIDVDSQSILHVSYIGYTPQEVKIGDKTSIDLILKEDSRQLDEVVVTALGIKREEKALSYNVQQLTNEDLTTVKSANFMNSLAGKVAGAQINSSAAGPGSAVKIVLRGAKSISLSNNALYVVDGVPMSNSIMSDANNDEGLVTSPATTDAAADINPDDIESISVLTGPSAAALYGYEGANGVILITTKKGKTGRASISYGHSSTFSNPFKMPEFQNEYGNAKKSNLSWGDKTSRRYDPEKFFNTGTNIVNSLSLSTGTETNQTYISASANNASGILPNNDYDRYNFTARNTAKLFNDKLVFDASINYIIQKNKNMTSQGKYFNPLPALYLFPRNEDFGEVQLYERYSQITEVNTQYWPYGDQGLDLQNPYWIMNNMNRESKRKRYMLSASLQYNITDWLNVVGRINVDNTNTRSTDKRESGTIPTFAGSKGRYRLDLQDESQLYTDIIANLNKTVDKFSFHVNLGGSFKDRSMDYHSTEGDLDKVTNWFTRENMDPTGYFKMDDDGLGHQIASLFASAEVGYKNYLYLTLTGRNDWDSAVKGPYSSKTSFFYPSVGLSALLSEVIQMPSWFTYLKARTSYTSVGQSYAPYLTHNYYYYDPQTKSYQKDETKAYDGLKPEITDSYEFGLNMRFLDGKINLDATYYISDTKNQTFNIMQSATSGYKYERIQSGNIRNSGIELSLGYDNKWGDFSWNSNYTFSYNKNKIKKLVNSSDGFELNEMLKARLGDNAAPELYLRKGGSMGDIYATSDFKRDINGYIHLDNVTQLPSIELIKDTKDYKKIGSLNADYYMGWRNSFSYKGIRLNILLSGRFGGKVISGTQAVMDRYGVSKRSAQLRNAGPIKIAGQDVSVKDFLGITAAGTGTSDFYAYDATNIRLQELSIEYTIPRRWINDIANVTVGFVGNNLAMLYCKAPFDPELSPSASSTYYTGVDYFMQPSLRNIGFSLKVQF